MSRISVVVLTKNEEVMLEACLKSVRWADEVLVIDDESTDRTPEIARAYADRVLMRKMDGFGAQRQFGLDQATGDWVFFVDADERVPEALRDEIRAAIDRRDGPVGYWVYSTNYFLDKPIRHGGWGTWPILRLTRRGRSRTDMKKVHEKIILDGPAGTLEQRLLHYTYRSIHQYLVKLDLYTTQMCADLYNSGRRVTLRNGWFNFGVKPGAAFFKKVVLLGGFLDGWEGLLIGYFTAIAVFINYVKLWELQKKDAA